MFASWIWGALFGVLHPWFYSKGLFSRKQRGRLGRKGALQEGIREWGQWIEAKESRERQYRY